MIVVDTSVWIDFFRSEDTPMVDELIELIGSDEDVALTGEVLTEVLQGCDSDDHADQITEQLHRFTILRPESTFGYMKAASLFRRARSKGVTVEGLGDLLIASACIRSNAWLLHNDRDFENLARVSDLKIWEPTT